MNRLELLQQVAGPMPPFIADLRNAIRRKRKTQTRRIVVPTQTKPFVPPLKMEPLIIDGVWETDDRGFPCWGGEHPDYPTGEKWFSCPYGKAGEIRYLREPLMRDEHGFARYVDDRALALDENGEAVVWRWKRECLPQIFLPKLLARTFVRLDAIRAERLWEISVSDIQAEGVRLRPAELALMGSVETKLKRNFQWLWDNINAGRGYGWDVSNWWLWVLVFSLIGDANDD